MLRERGSDSCAVNWVWHLLGWGRQTHYRLLMLQLYAASLCNASANLLPGSCGGRCKTTHENTTC